MKATLGGRARPVVLSASRLEAYHSRLYEPITDEPSTFDRYVETDGLRWLARAEELAIEQRYDVVLETELIDPDAFAASARAFKAAGYQVEVAILAVHEAFSRLGVLQRHIRALEAFGFGRLATQPRHDAGYAGVLRAADLIDEGDWTDRVGVLRSSEDEGSNAPHLEDFDVSDATFTCPDLTTFTRLDELGLEVTSP